MKKNFLKKLAFTMAFATVFTSLAPAAGVFAASKPSLNVGKKLTLLLGTEREEFDINVKNKVSGSKYEWTTSNKKVATVDKAGVVEGQAVGSAKVTLKITLPTKKTATLSTTVDVKDNIKEVAINNAPEKALKVNEEYDFNRTIVETFGGNTKAHKGAVTRWFLNDTKTATISDSGVFKATEAGEYEVTAKSFQSEAKYKEFLADATKTDLVTATSETVKVKVVPSIVDVKQVNATKVNVTFDADMSKVVTKDNLKVYSIVSGTKVTSLVKEVKFDEAGKVATVEMYVAFNGGTDYAVVYEAMEGTFTAAKAEVSAVAKIEFTFNEIVYTEGAKALEVKLLNADGVDITTPALKDRVTYALENNVGYLSPSPDNKLTLFAKGDVAVVKATFHTYEYDKVTYEEKVVTASGTFTAVDATTHTIGSTSEWTLSTAAPDWSKALVKKIAAGDTGYTVYARFLKTDNKTYSYSYAGTFTNGTYDNKITFGSSNNDVLIVDSLGTVYPVKAGSAVIICYYDGKAVATFPVVVEASRTVAEFSIDKPVVTLTNSASVNATETVKLTVKDQLGEDFIGKADLSKLTITALKSNPDQGAGFGPVAFSADKKQINVTANGVTKGTWTFLVKAYDKTTVLTVNIQEPTDATVVYYKLVLDNTAVDTAVANDKVLKTVTPTLLGYASNGVANFKSTWADGFSYTIAKDGNAITTSSLLDGTIEVATGGAIVSSPVQTAVSGGAITVVSGTSVTKLEKGMYVVTAKNSAGDVKGTATFTVNDSTVAATYALEKAEVTKTATLDTVLEAVRDAIKVSLDGTEIADAKLYGVKYIVNGVESTDSNADVLTTGNLFIKEVKFLQTFTQGGTTYAVEYTVNVGRTIVIK